MGKGSIILKAVIILLVFLLVVVIAVPEKIWTEEDKITNQSRHNMLNIFEAEQFFHRKTGEYTPNLDTIMTVIESDTNLQQRKRLVKLTNDIYDIIEKTLDIPTIYSILTISKSVSEVQGDISGNERYFEKYKDLNKTKDEILMNLTRFDSSAAFPQFCFAKGFIDSLNDLKNRINEFRLQNAAYLAQNHLDSIKILLPKVEINTVKEFWDNLNNKITNLIKEANKTDLKIVSNIIDRLLRFNDRINSSMQILIKAKTQSDLNELNNLIAKMRTVYQNFISSENFQLTQRFGLLELTDVESTLLEFGPENFNGPDSKKPYIVDVNNNQLTIESPNLLDDFANNNKQIVEPIRNNSLFTYFESISETIDSTHKIMTQQVPLIRRYSDILLSMKEIMAEMDNLNSVKFYGMVENLKLLVDTVQTEKKISALKPIFEETLNSVDSLAYRIRNKNVKDLEAKLEYFGNKIQAIDSTLSSDALPSRIRRQIQPIYPTYKPVFSILNNLKNSLTEELAKKIKTASDKLEQSMLQVLNGYSENVYVIFRKKHINHGYIQNGVKSWEEQQ